MRPAERNKKKNAIYKKKHNTHTDKVSVCTSREKGCRRIERDRDDCQQTEFTSRVNERSQSSRGIMRNVEYRCRTHDSNRGLD